MITLKLEDLVNSTEALQKLSNTSLKARPAFTVSKMLKEAEKELANFNEVRMNLINKYGEKDEDGKLITDENDNCKITAEHINDFSNELQELVATTIEINANKLTLEDLGNADFTPSEIAALEPFVDIE
jgi:hypothetical protein